MKISTSTTTLNAIYVLDHIYNFHMSIVFTSDRLRKPGDSKTHPLLMGEPPWLLETPLVLWVCKIFRFFVSLSYCFLWHRTFSMAFTIEYNLLGTTLYNNTKRDEVETEETNCKIVITLTIPQ